ncbi:hypothetical protein BVRB_8g193580 [Beta vulgaris subsp. vulgaris]|nr:hypothetical protein BVRB_8g193580 [Beta vulgaris subsp. vulgaris]
MLQSKQICRKNDKKEEDAAAAYEILPPQSKLKLKSERYPVFLLITKKHYQG